MNKKVWTDEELITLIEQKSEMLAELKLDKSLVNRIEELTDLLEAMEGSTELSPPSSIGEALQFKIAEEKRSVYRKPQYLQLAAAVSLLIVGFFAGRLTNQPGEEILALKNEMQLLRAATLTSPLQEYSASDRIMAVNKIEASYSELNWDLIATLVNTLDADDSPNVRFAALQALNKYIQVPEVRAMLLKSLENQTDVLIQIALINVLVEVTERGAISPLKKLMEDEGTAEEVKRQASIALKILT